MTAEHRRDRAPSIIDSGPGCIRELFPTTHNNGALYRCIPAGDCCKSWEPIPSLTLRSNIFRRLHTMGTNYQGVNMGLCRAWIFRTSTEHRRWNDQSLPVAVIIFSLKYYLAASTSPLEGKRIECAKEIWKLSKFTSWSLSRSNLREFNLQFIY